ncbi:hypothetical protein DL96DRAFT_1702100 [Flagelloscypha sp. PMI_526]|nr:hypothetical protein DL96DRAFT_1702100 [Flagelloscypha sp. PMI_526]
MSSTTTGPTTKGLPGGTILSRILTPPSRATCPAVLPSLRREIPQSIQRTLAQSIFADLIELESDSPVQPKPVHRFLRTCDLDLGAVCHYELGKDASLSVKSSFGGEGDEGMLAADLFDAVNVKVSYVPTFSCTSFVIGQTMNCVMRGETFRPLPKTNGFSVETLPISKSSLDSQVQRHGIHDLLTSKSIPSNSSNTSTADVEEAVSSRPSVASITSITSSFDDLSVSFNSLSSDPMFDAESVLFASSSMPSLASKSSSLASSGEMDLADTSLSSLDSGRLSSGPATPPRQKTLRSSQVFQSYDHGLAFEPMQISPPPKTQNSPFTIATQTSSPRSVLGGWNGQLRIPRTVPVENISKGKSKKKSKSGSSASSRRRPRPGKENIDPNLFH